MLTELIFEKGEEKNANSVVTIYYSIMFLLLSYKSSSS